MDNFISVIMPSYLQPYKGSSGNRIYKFNRAVDSFLNNDFINKELIIVSDGCEDTCNIYNEKYSRYSQIILIKLEKQPLFSGNVREAGLKVATGNIIAYLDTDDIFGIDHLSAIDIGFNETNSDFVYFNYIVKYFHFDHLPVAERIVKLEKGIAGTSCIAHKNYREISWSGCNEYGHDWTFIERLIKLYPKYTKIYGCKYFVCHIPNTFES